ncbi:MAG: molybdopterin molybdotransferase MoeA [Firmicutes bacterium]|nr:molybdopterin molybdotransferase MoeA [Bacillota bacterium]
MKLLNVDLLETALDKLEQEMTAAGKNIIETETLPVHNTLGRVLAEDIFSAENIPGFNRSTVDGYAVVAADTAGASESIPAFLEIAGEVEMGKAAPGVITSGKCMYVPTGGMVPDGADAVAMVEYCQPFGADQMAVYSPLSYGRNMVFAGDDVTEGEKLLSRGRRIRPADIGLLCAAGNALADVYCPWKVYIISTGDEIVMPWEKPGPGQVRDVNTYSLIAEAERMGLEVVGWDVVRDNEKLLREKVAGAMETADFVCISGGSSQGKKDATEAIIDDLTSSGAFTHGLAVKPGKPTILGFDRPSETAVVGLPGHPVAAVLLFREIVGGIWQRFTGADVSEKKITVSGIMAANMAASPGRKTFQLVELDYDHQDDETGLPRIIPVLGKSGLIRTLSRADGYIVIDVNDEGINKGEQVKVHLLG